MAKYVTTFVLCGFLGVAAFAAYANDTQPKISACPINHAVYKPHPFYGSEASAWSLRITPLEGKEKNFSRIAFFNFTHIGNDAVADTTYRLAYGCSNGLSVCRISALYGQFSKMSDMKEFKTTLNFNVIPLNKDLSPVRLSFDQKAAPEALIFPETGAAFYYNDWNTAKNYMTSKLADPKKFSGFDIWKLNDCNNG